MIKRSSRFWLNFGGKMWITMAIIIATLTVHVTWHLQSRKYLGTLIMVTWAFVWLPVVLSYCFSAMARCKEISLMAEIKNFDVNTFQRIAALLFADVLNIVYSRLVEDTETATWIFLIYIFVVFPIQIGMVLVFDLLLYLGRKVS